MQLKQRIQYIISNLHNSQTNTSFPFALLRVCLLNQQQQRQQQRRAEMAHTDRKWQSQHYYDYWVRVRVLRWIVGTKITWQIVMANMELCTIVDRRATAQQ